MDLYGHRGARGLSPENTIPGYRTAMAIGVNFIDMDIAMTKDYVLIVTHGGHLDPYLTRKRGSLEVVNDPHWHFKDHTYEEVLAYDVGRIVNPDYAQKFPLQIPVDDTPIPKLVDVIRYAKKRGGNQIKFNIEMKVEADKPEHYPPPEEFAEVLMKTLKAEAILERTEVQAFYWKCLAEIQKWNKQWNTHVVTQYLTHIEYMNLNNPDVDTASLWTDGRFLRDPKFKGSIPKMIKDAGGTAWGAWDGDLTEAQVKEAHDLGLRVLVWSLAINNDFDPSLTSKMFDFQVDGIITDRPDIVRGMMAARGIPLPLAFIEDIKEN